MTLQYSTAARNAMGDGITATVGSNATLRIYSGTKPASANDALSGNTLLVSLPCSATFAPAASGGSLTLNNITTTNAVASGTATFFRVLKSDGTTVVIQGKVADASGADVDLVLNTVSITSTLPVAINSATLPMPGE